MDSTHNKQGDTDDDSEDFKELAANDDTNSNSKLPKDDNKIIPKKDKSKTIPQKDNSHLIRAVSIADGIIPSISNNSSSDTTAENNSKKEAPVALVVVIPTFYTDLTSSRFLLCVETCKAAAKYNIRLIIVDGSPAHQTVRNALTQAGSSYDEDDDYNTLATIQWVKVYKQASNNKGQKGAALREGIQYAYNELSNEHSLEPAVIAFQEPEKVDMMHRWKQLAEKMYKGKKHNCDIFVPRREKIAFYKTYPREQYHSEYFCNIYLDSLATKVNFPSIDWTFGPIAFRAKWALVWIDYNGDLWDAQIVPMVHAQRFHQAIVKSSTIDYIHAECMKLEEEGKPEWGAKRLRQLNVLFEVVGHELQQSLVTI